MQGVRWSKGKWNEKTGEQKREQKDTKQDRNAVVQGRLCILPPTPRMILVARSRDLWRKERGGSTVSSSSRLLSRALMLLQRGFWILVVPYRCFSRFLIFGFRCSNGCVLILLILVLCSRNQDLFGVCLGVHFQYTLLSLPFTTSYGLSLEGFSAYGYGVVYDLSVFDVLHEGIWMSPEGKEPASVHFLPNNHSPYLARWLDVIFVGFDLEVNGAVSRL